MKIEIGEYVRTKNGDIVIFRGYNERKTSQWIYKLEFQKRKFPKYCAEGYIVNHSKNIIDLIEVGDYVNGKEIHEIDENRKRLYSYEKDDYNIILNRDIQRVVTKEQFSNMEYRL